MAVKPGYKLTEVGVIPEDWERMPLEKLSAFITKGSTPTTHGFRWEPSGILFLRSECVSDDGLDLTQSMFISAHAHQMLRRSEVCGGDILMTITGNVGRVVYFLDIETANINQHIARIRISSSSVDSGYIYHYLSQPAIRVYFGSITTGQAYPQISLRQVRNVQIPLPPLPEQHAIATALSDVDALISSLDALISKKKQIKQGAMQELLSGKRRLPGFSGEWEVKRLGEIGDIDPENLSNNTAADFFFYYISLESVDNGTLIDSQPYSFGTAPSRARRILRDEDIMISTVRPNLKSHLYVSASISGMICSTGFSVLRPHKSIVYPQYIYANLFGGAIAQQINSLISGSNYPAISRSDIANLFVPLPPLPEQQAIAAILSDMDAEITTLETRRDKTKLLKQGMMQELLTGRIRLIPPAAHAVSA
ncbi:MAG: restriction endonuclease subunit S [Acidithiobacillus ferrooxidans]|nr:restriction endonuclease subunit S [Acidithiobacillus ferrooxidans]MDD5003085.1 restriction endonuclease subunit S [Acidithiobacillus sp.]MDD5377789.1 restriction endonuclease subunit S [Acidithiobacillus sp.]MDD5577486.1 restriction endonuclease subunit S [Acidithiobacillus sp.]